MSKRTQAPPEPVARTFTQASLIAPPRQSGWRGVSGSAFDAARLVWRAAPRQLLTTLVLQTALALGLGVLVAKRLLDELIAGNSGSEELSALAPAFAILIGAVIAMGLMNAVIQHQQRLLTEKVFVLVFDEIIRVANSVELDAFEDPVFYDQLQRARTSGTYRPLEMVTSLNSLTTASLASLGITFVLFRLEPLLVPLVLLAALPLLLASVLNSRRLHEFEYYITPRNRERTYLMEILTGQDAAKEIRVFNATSYLRRRYDELTAERYAMIRTFAAQRLKVSAAAAVCNSIGIAIALGSLAVLLGTDRIDVATAVAGGAAMQLLSGRLSGFSGSVGKLVESTLFLDDYRTFVKLAEGRAHAEPAPPPDPDAVPEFGGLTLDKVSFRYPHTERTVLDEISLDIEKGEVVALVGENGSGKTTLVKLICALHQPTGGSLAWGGSDYRDLDPAEVRAEITVLFQDFLRYELTVADNIALGRVERESGLAALERAAEQAGAMDAIRRLPDGFDTRLGRQFYGGHEMSLGQWQRLALARAFYRDGSFLIFDEPTASLDPKAEAALFEQIRLLAEGRSVLLISHRFSSVRSADRIFVLEQGRLIESGNHDELMALDGQYAHMFRLQAAAYMSDSPT
ncbi:MAG: ABC transporter ATP-binding protein [Thermoleophilia bacterium]|nr:ABC transporter ATP-binding protein [Thermoleophilia bacterium]